jgi:methionine biosynthesis protein MetW
MTRYSAAIDTTIPNNSHSQVLDLVGENKRVLDVGCWEGDLGVAMTANGCEVHGLELIEAAAQVAAERLAGVTVADLERTSLTDHFEPESFDAIVFADVLEHLRDPAKVLSDAVGLLAPDGRVIISIPNVAHGSLRLALLQGRWQMTETGLLDNTHLRFVTHESLLELVNLAGLVVDDLRGVVVDCLGSEVDIDPEELPTGVVEWVRDQPEAAVYQFQLSARVPRPGEGLGEQPPLATVLPHADVRPADRFAHERADAWFDRLRTTDKIIGLEAAGETAAANARRSHAQVARLNKKVATLTTQLQEARKPKQAPAPTWRRAARKVKRSFKR